MSLLNRYYPLFSSSNLIRGIYDCSNLDLNELYLPDIILYELNCSNNKLTKLPELPDTLIELYCQNNLLTELPNLKNVCILECDWHMINYTPTFKNYKYFLYVSRLPTTQVFEHIRRVAVVIIQRNTRYFLMKRKFTKSIAIIKIQRGCHNWLWNPICRDGKMGINLRLGLNMEYFVNR
jgi:Leucine-rich repeat (LRR) protein